MKNPECCFLNHVRKFAEASDSFLISLDLIGVYVIQFTEFSDVVSCKTAQIRHPISHDSRDAEWFNEERTHSGKTDTCMWENEFTVQVHVQFVELAFSVDGSQLDIQEK